MDVSRNTDTISIIECAGTWLTAIGFLVLAGYRKITASKSPEAIALREIKTEIATLSAGNGRVEQLTVVWGPYSRSTSSGQLFS
jgi:hypothetical protein